MDLVRCLSYVEPVALQVRDLARGLGYELSPAQDELIFNRDRPPEARLVLLSTYLTWVSGMLVADKHGGRYPAEELPEAVRQLENAACRGEEILGTCPEALAGAPPILRQCLHVSRLARAHLNREVRRR
jgi:hypothetical protein